MIKRISHFGIVVQNLEESAKLWTETYGATLLKRDKVEAEGITNLFLRIGDNLIELMEPTDKSDMNNAIARRLASKGEGIYHLATVVEDLAMAGKDLESKGVALTYREPIASEPEGRIVVHPRCASGVLLELVQRGQELP